VPLRGGTICSFSFTLFPETAKMATFYSRGIQNPNSIKSALAIYGSAPVRGIQDNIAMTTAMVVNDTLEFGVLPSTAILLPTSTIVHANLGTSVTMNVGFDDGGAGFASKLGSALALSAAGTKAGMAAVATADIGKRVWELAGFTADPRRNLRLIGTITGANVTAAGGLFYHFAYVI
jgi:hypothetical protein